MRPNAPKLCTLIYRICALLIAKFCALLITDYIIITTKKENDFIVISVKDNGIGIDASKFDSIFSKYYRLENFIEGSGIGLYLVKEIVSREGGKILVNSVLNEWTEFQVYLKIV